MINKNRLIIAGLVLCIALVAFGVSVLYIKHELELVEVYVAKDDLSARTLLDESRIQIIKVPKAYLSENVVTKKNDIVGKYIKLNVSIPKGSLIYQSSIESIDSAIDEPALLLNVNQAVFAIDVNISSTSGNTLQNVSKVDLYARIKHKQDTDLNLLLKPVNVLHIQSK